MPNATDGSRLKVPGTPPDNAERHRWPTPEGPQHPLSLSTTPNTNHGLRLKAIGIHIYYLATSTVTDGFMPEDPDTYTLRQR